MRKLDAKLATSCKVYVAPPVTRFKIGLIKLSVREVTIPENALPMITPTAMSITFPRSAKVLNSCINFFIAPDSLLLDFLHYNTGRLSGKGDGADFVER